MGEEAVVLMVQFQVISGKMAGSVYAARHFPFHIGRARNADLRLEEPGVWDEHLRLSLVPGEGFVLQTRPPALAALNGQPFEEALLRNGDAIEIGGLKLHFWLGETRQKKLRWREAWIWALVVLVTAAQVFLIYRLMR